MRKIYSKPAMVTIEIENAALLAGSGISGEVPDIGPTDPKNNGGSDDPGEVVPMPGSTEDNGNSQTGA